LTIPAFAKRQARTVSIASYYRSMASIER